MGSRFLAAGSVESLISHQMRRRSHHRVSMIGVPAAVRRRSSSLSNIRSPFFESILTRPASRACDRRITWAMAYELVELFCHYHGRWRPRQLFGLSSVLFGRQITVCQASSTIRWRAIACIVSVDARAWCMIVDGGLRPASCSRPHDQSG